MYKNIRLNIDVFTVFLRCNADCPPVHTYVPCAYGSLPDKYGCPNGCDCIDGCSFSTCLTGEYCHSLPDGSARCCPILNCTKCEYSESYVLDINHCPTCQCLYQLDLRCPCGCPGNSYMLDSNGVHTCQCNDPCKYYECPEGTKCTFEYLSSSTTPRAGLRMNCVPICPQIRCTLYCKYGFAKDCNGCEICKCYQPCNGVECRKNYYCAVRQYQCIQEPCPVPEAYCKKYCDPQEILLNMEDLINCDPSVENSCGKGNTCTTIQETDEHVCCIGLTL